MIIIISTLIISLVRYFLKKYGYCSNTTGPENDSERTAIIIDDEIKPLFEDVTLYGYVNSNAINEEVVIDGNENNEIIEGVSSSLHAASTTNLREILKSLLSENCINGAGFLALPWAFGRSGVFLSTICLISVVMLSNLTKTYLVESIAVAEGLMSSQSSILDEDSIRDALSSSVSLSEMASSLFLQEEDKRAYNYERWKKQITAEVYSRLSSSNLLVRKGASFDDDHHNFETLTLTRIFLGKRAQRMFIIFNSLAMIAMLASFVAVFASSVATALPLLSTDYHNYSLYVVLFALILIPSNLCCNIQQHYLCIFETLSACRIFLIFLMVFTSSALAHFKYNDDNNNTTATTKTTTLCQSTDLHFYQHYSSEQQQQFIYRNFDFTGLHITIPILVFATVLHRPVSGLSQPTANKTHLRSIFIISLVMWGILLSILGISITWAFNVNQYQSYNLNWICLVSNSSSWLAATTTDDNNHIRHGQKILIFFIKIFAAIILCFPAIDVIYAFRHKSIALANNIIEATFVTNDSTNYNEINYQIRNTIRIITSIIPIIIAYFLRNLAILSDYAGIFFLLVDFAFPSIIFIRSKRIAKWNNVILPKFHGFVNSTLWAWIILYICVGTFITIFYFFIIFELKMIQ